MSPLIMCGNNVTTFTMIMSRSKVGGINEISPNPPSQLVKGMGKLGAEYYKDVENIDDAEKEMGHGSRRYCLSEYTYVASLMLLHY